MEFILGHLIRDMDPFYIFRISVSFTLFFFFLHDENKQVTSPDVFLFFFFLTFFLASFSSE